MGETEHQRMSLAPLIGLGIVIVVSVISWLIAPGVLHWLASVLPNFPGSALPVATTRPVFTAIIVVLTLIVFGLAAALVTPKPARSSSAARMEKERAALRRRQKAERAQARKPKGSR